MSDTILALLAQPAMTPYLGAFAGATGMVALEVGLALVGMGSSPGGDSAGPEVDSGIDGPTVATPEGDIDIGEIDDLGWVAQGDTAHGGAGPSDISPDRDAQAVMMPEGWGADAGDTVSGPMVAAAAAAAGGGLMDGATGRRQGFAEARTASPGRRAMRWLRLDRGPVLVWIAGALIGFGLVGMAGTFWTSFLPEAAIMAIAALGGIQTGRGTASFWGVLVPADETTAISRSSYHNRQGIVVVGTARRGEPAQVRFRDGHGNLHYLLAEPFHEEDAIVEGTTVAIVRARDGRHVLLALDGPESESPRRT